MVSPGAVHPYPLVTPLFFFFVFVYFLSVVFGLSVYQCYQLYGMTSLQNDLLRVDCMGC